MNNAAALRRQARKLANPNRWAKFLFSVFRLVFICGICFTILYPLLTKLSMSFMDETDLYDRTVKAIAKHFIPAELSGNRAVYRLR